MKLINLLRNGRYRNEESTAIIEKYRLSVPDGWKSFSFVGSRWNNINKEERKLYLKNAYRVLLTRARQGMVIVVPEGDEEDATRKPEYYDDTFEYLMRIGIKIL